MDDGKPAGAATAKAQVRLAGLIGTEPAPMFGNVYPPADVPCPRCHQQPNVVTYVYFNTVALFCKRCEYAWQVDESAYPELATLVRPVPEDGPKPPAHRE